MTQIVLSDNTISSTAVAMTGPKTFFIYGLEPNDKLIVSVKATGGSKALMPVYKSELQFRNEPITLEFYNTDLHFQIPDNNGTVTIEY